MNSELPGRVLVTSGPTRAYIDRIRYIANTSSGALGSRIVAALADVGLPVVHLHGYGSEIPDPGGRPGLIESVPVTTVDDLIQAIHECARAGDVTAVVHAMAVLDYVPESRFDGKKKSGDDIWDIRLVRTPKVIGMMRELLPDAFFVGFKLETGVSEQGLRESALRLLDAHGLDLVVANDLERVGPKRHEAVCFGKDGLTLGRFSTKDEIAGFIAGEIAGRRR